MKFDKIYNTKYKNIDITKYRQLNLVLILL